MTIAVVMLLVVATVASAQTSPMSPRVRPQSARADELLQDAVRRSTTIGGLLSMIEASDVLVFLDVVYDPSALLGRTTVIGATVQARLLHVALSGRVPPDRLVELLGHELEHVVEIARTPEIRDTYTLARAYERLGWQFESGHFETEAARYTELQVRADLQAIRNARYRKKD
jgi:hypothetical protein